MPPQTVCLLDRRELSRGLWHASNGNPVQPTGMAIEHETVGLHYSVDSFAVGRLAPGSQRPPLEDGMDPPVAAVGRRLGDDRLDLPRAPRPVAVAGRSASSVVPAAAPRGWSERPRSPPPRVADENRIVSAPSGWAIRQRVTPLSAIDLPHRCTTTKEVRIGKSCNAPQRTQASTFLITNRAP
jgi:hypothetical protein